MSLILYYINYIYIYIHTVYIYIYISLKINIHKLNIETAVILLNITHVILMLFYYISTKSQTYICLPMSQISRNLSRWVTFHLKSKDRNKKLHFSYIRTYIVTIKHIYPEIHITLTWIFSWLLFITINNNWVLPLI